jgi:hypothetical protein
VRFIERDQYILTHPAPGDSRVHLRFVSGSMATVLRVNAATGWIEVRGEPLQGPANTGWITPRYLASQSGDGGPTADPLAWCPPKGSLAPHRNGRLRLATWRGVCVSIRPMPAPTPADFTADRPTGLRLRPCDRAMPGGALAPNSIGAHEPAPLRGRAVQPGVEAAAGGSAVQLPVRSAAA